MKVVKIKRKLPYKIEGEEFKRYLELSNQYDKEGDKLIAELKKLEKKKEKILNVFWDGILELTGIEGHKLDLTLDIEYKDQGIVFLKKSSKPDLQKLLNDIRGM